MKKILVVDDSATIRMVISGYIKNLGCEVVEASGPLQAIEILKGQDFNCIMTDYNMPDMNGARLIKEIKKIKKFIPCILLTSETDVNSLKLARECGAATILEKPINEFKLKNILKIIVGI